MKILPDAGRRGKPKDFMKKSIDISVKMCDNILIIFPIGIQASRTASSVADDQGTATNFEDISDAVRMTRETPAQKRQAFLGTEVWKRGSTRTSMPEKITRKIGIRNQTPIIAGAGYGIPAMGFHSLSLFFSPKRHSLSPRFFFSPKKA